MCAEELAKKELNVLCSHAAWQPQFDEIARSRHDALITLKMMDYDRLLQDFDVCLGLETRRLIQRLLQKVTSCEHQKSPSELVIS